MARRDRRVRAAARLHAANERVIALLLTLSGPPQPSPPWYGSAGRIYTTSTVHVGVRPALFMAPAELDLGCTLQITARIITI
jgi:hypothetical protein